MKKSDYPDNLPLSRKAYDGFVGRIRAILGTTFEGDSMIQALNDYLKGDHSYRWGLDPACRLAFEFLRQEIDRAIERSRKARERAALRRSRKAESEAAAVASADVAEPVAGTVDAVEHDACAESRDAEREVTSAVGAGCKNQVAEMEGCGDDAQSGLLRSTERSARRERTCISVGV